MINPWKFGCVSEHPACVLSYDNEVWPPPLVGNSVIRLTRWGRITDHWTLQITGKWFRAPSGQPLRFLISPSAYKERQRGERRLSQSMKRSPITRVYGESFSDSGFKAAKPYYMWVSKYSKVFCWMRAQGWAKGIQTVKGKEAAGASSWTASDYGLDFHLDWLSRLVFPDVFLQL